MHHTKIIATIGPASSEKRIIGELMQAGVNVFRLNFSHGTHKERRDNIRNIRDCAKKLKLPIAIMADIQGPKIRTGNLKNTVVHLRKGSTVRLTTKRISGDEKIIGVDYAQFSSVVKKGTTVLLSEGMITLRVMSTSNDTVICKVIQGGIVGERKGVNIIGMHVASIITKKDRHDIRFALSQKVDYFALSFVRSAADVITIKKFIKGLGYTIPLIAKIEKPEAVDNVREILSEVEGVMVARGDLGVEGRLEEIPIWQKKIIAEANRCGKMVITATQMLESMIFARKPTRAEVTDVANAIFDGTCALMLSGETAVGKYPVQVIQTMHRIIHAAEKSDFINYYFDQFDRKVSSATFSVAHAAIDAARDAQVKAIVVFTISGFTARFISKRRPHVPIFALTPDTQVYNQMSLFWGVYPIGTTLGKNIYRVLRHGEKQLLKKKLLKKGDRAVVVFGSVQKSGGTDQMKIVTIGEKGV
ncbi:MAG: pyruvate kinase [Candidatus Omnitrophica bacterium]|nr:pyruvate kinase [Candidatus Omnitrophota bacterium]